MVGRAAADVGEGHHAYGDALRGEAGPGDLLGHSDALLHSRGWAHDSMLPSWTTARSVAERFARGWAGDSLILRTTLEEQANRIVPRPNDRC